LRFEHGVLGSNSRLRLDFSLVFTAALCKYVTKAISFNFKNVKRGVMKVAFLIAKLVLAGLIIAAAPGLAADEDLPLVDGKRAVATVNNEPITLEAFNRAIADAHAGRPGGEQKAGRIDFSGIMERLVNTRLLLIEAKNMGLDTLSQTVNSVKKFSQEALIENLMDRQLKKISADDTEVEQLYQTAVREWKITALKFKKEADAKKVEARLKAGDSFDELARKAVAEGIAEGGQEEIIRDKDLIRPVARLVSEMAAGSISPVVPVGKEEFIIFKLAGTRLPEKEDTQAREKAKQMALNRKKTSAARDYIEALKKKHAAIDEKLIDALDYESEAPGFEKLLQDKRVVARIKGEKPITVGELSEAMKKKFFHGIDRAVQAKRINRQKRSVLDSMLENRVLLKEASIQGIAKTESYQEKVREYENSVIFGTFVQKVIVPEIKLEEKELQAYYRKNSRSYTSPQMLRIKSLVFKNRSAAAVAFDKLVKGTDFNWLNAHAEGQADKNTPGLLMFDGSVVMANSLPENLQEVLSGVTPEEPRLFESPDGYFYVLYVFDVVAPDVRPFEDVKKEIANEVFSVKITAAIEAWAARLKEYYPVEIYSKDLMR